MTTVAGAGSWELGGLNLFYWDRQVWWASKKIKIYHENQRFAIHSLRPSSPLNIVF